MIENEASGKHHCCLLAPSYPFIFLSLPSCACGPHLFLLLIFLPPFSFFFFISHLSFLFLLELTNSLFLHHLLHPETSRTSTKKHPPLSNLLSPLFSGDRFWFGVSSSFGCKHRLSGNSI